MVAHLQPEYKRNLTHPEKDEVGARHLPVNVYEAPPSVGIGTSTTFERSLTGEPLLSLLLRQSPAQTKKPIISPTAGWWFVIGAHRAGS